MEQQTHSLNIFHCKVVELNECQDDKNTMKLHSPQQQQGSKRPVPNTASLPPDRWSISCCRVGLFRSLGALEGQSASRCPPTLLAMPKNSCPYAAVGTRAVRKPQRELETLLETVNSEPDIASRTKQERRGQENSVDAPMPRSQGRAVAQRSRRSRCMSGGWGEEEKEETEEEIRRRRRRRMKGSVHQTFLQQNSPSCCGGGFRSMQRFNTKPQHLT